MAVFKAPVKKTLGGETLRGGTWNSRGCGAAFELFSVDLDPDPDPDPDPASALPGAQRRRARRPAPPDDEEGLAGPSLSDPRATLVCLRRSRAGTMTLAPPLPAIPLNPEQALAAAHGEGPLLVIAGAGTGKTRTLAARVSHLIEQGCPPERILLLTFTRQAAREMLSRCHAGRTKGVWGGTFHAIAHRLLRIYAEPMGLAPGFTVVDRSDAEDLIDLERTALGFKSAPRGGAGTRGTASDRFPKKATCLAIYSRCVNAKETVEKTVLERFPWVSGHEPALKRLFRAYEERKQKSSVLDLDDLLVWWKGLVED